MPNTPIHIKNKRRLYYEQNKEKLKAYQTEYQKKWLQNPEKKKWKKEYMKEYHKTYQQLYNQRNPEKRKMYVKKYQETHKPQIKEYLYKYNRTPEVRKRTRIANWKQIGIKDEHFSELYDYYIQQTHCMICGDEFKTSKSRCLDHDHKTGEVRYICCLSCNTGLLSRRHLKKKICDDIKNE